MKHIKQKERMKMKTTLKKAVAKKAVAKKVVAKKQNSTTKNRYAEKAKRLVNEAVKKGTNSYINVGKICDIFPSKKSVVNPEKLSDNDQLMYNALKAVNSNWKLWIDHGYQIRGRSQETMSRYRIPQKPVKKSVKKAIAKKPIKKIIKKRK